MDTTDKSTHCRIKMLLQNNTQHVVDMNDKEETKSCNNPLVADSFCVAHNVDCHIPHTLGFEPSDISLVNDIIFGISKDQISVCSHKSNEDHGSYKYFEGNINISGHFPIWSNNSGLLLIGGESGGITQITFNGDTFETNLNIKFRDPMMHPSALVSTNKSGNEMLFICGAIKQRRKIVGQCCLYDFKEDEWRNLSDMKHGRECAGITGWYERGNKVIVGGGYGQWANGQVVEEYDIIKNEWTVLPLLNEPHKKYPALVTSNNILLCFGGGDYQDRDLGAIELYDPRDSVNKWIFVDGIEKYFKITEWNKGAGYNCFLPLSHL